MDYNDYSEAKKYLKHYRDLHDRLEVIDAQMTSIRSPSLREPTGGPRKSINDFIDEKYAIKEEMAVIEKAVASVDDYRYRMVLRYKYFEFMTLEEIADKCMHYSLRQIKKFHSEGIRKLCLCM